MLRRSLKTSSKSNKSASSKSDRIEGKVKFIELFGQEAFLEKCQQVGNEAQRLRMQEKVAKAREIVFIPDHGEVGEEQELQREILGNQQSLHSRQPTKKENYEDSHSQ